MKYHLYFVTWNMHLSALWRAIPLCFAFDRVNYKRWQPVYYEDCFAIPDQFPDKFLAKLYQLGHKGNTKNLSDEI